MQTIESKNIITAIPDGRVKYKYMKEIIINLTSYRFKLKFV